MTDETILVVEDEPDIVEVLRYNLEREGYEVLVETDGSAGMAAALRRRPDLVVLDLMLPGQDGLDVLRGLRAARETAAMPVLLLTAKAEEIDRVVGLELGADDYVTKPFSPREVLLRIKAILRRAHGGGDPRHELLEVNGVVLDVGGHLLRRGEEEIALTATEFRLLKLLMERRGRVQSREQLLAEAWGYSEDVDSRTVDTHVRRLRGKLGERADRIETVIGVGYRFRA